jgi:phosphonate transport system permease protein
MFREGKQMGSGTASVLETKRKQKVTFVFIILGLAVVFLWASWGTGFNIPKLIVGIPHIYRLALRMLPPGTEILSRLVSPTIETIQMAFLGTLIPIFFVIPLSLMAALNTSPHPLIGYTTRILMNTLRSVPELIWALLLVSAVGLGPFPGVLALTLHTIGGLGKYYYEAIEAVDRNVIEAMEATGADRFKVIWFGILPTSLPVMMSSTLWYYEYNNRSSTILGLVGAGGIGLALTHAFQDFRYPEAITCLIIIVLIVTVVDRLSAYLRARII